MPSEGAGAPRPAAAWERAASIMEARMLCHACARTAPLPPVGDAVELVCPFCDSYFVEVQRLVPAAARSSSSSGAASGAAVRRRRLVLATASPAALAAPSHQFAAALHPATPPSSATASLAAIRGQQHASQQRLAARLMGRRVRGQRLLDYDELLFNMVGFGGVGGAAGGVFYRGGEVRSMMAF